jgi:phosphomannomutase/phosphoglucomutase
MPRLFGTNGIRGVVNEDMNLELASNIGRALGTYLGRGKAAIGTDTRTSNEMIKSAVTSGLLSIGIDVVDLGIVPTPTLQYFVKHNEIDCGVMITASHNPPQFNGIKCVDRDGTEYSREEEEKIESNYFSGNFNKADWKNIGRYSRDNTSIRKYIDGIMGLIEIDIIKKAKPKVVLDCGNGAGSLVSPYLLEKIGCSVITINSHPQGTFPGHHSEPTPENLIDLIEATKNFKANIGIAHDGDADRTIFIDEKGSYLYGDRILTLVAKELLKANNGGLIITPVASSRALEDVTLQNNGKIEYTKVGSPIVARRMMETNALFGGEENGGLIFPKLQYCRDGAMTAAKVVEILAVNKRPFSELISELPQYALYKTKVHCPQDKKEKALEKLKEDMSEKELNTTDGVKIMFDSAWVLVRPSGTEPLYRIFAESETQDQAENLGEEHKKLIENIIESLD